MFYIADETIEKLIKEDLPFFDLTTHLLEIEQELGLIRFVCREDATLAGVDEALRIFQKLDVRATKVLPGGTQVSAGQWFLEAEGRAGSLHAAWRLALSLLEHCSGIATRTRRMVDKARRVNPAVAVVATRKNFPGTKELAIKSVVAGGGYPHRLGLSETILVFKQHLVFLGGMEALLNRMDQIKGSAREKKIIIETETAEEAVRLAGCGVDGIQFDKMPPALLTPLVPRLRQINPQITLLAAGSINEANVESYAASGVDVIVTTSVYFGKPVDMGVEMVKMPPSA